MRTRPVSGATASAKSICVCLGLTLLVLLTAAACKSPNETLQPSAAASDTERSGDPEMGARGAEGTRDGGDSAPVVGDPTAANPTVGAGTPDDQPSANRLHLESVRVFATSPMEPNEGPTLTAHSLQSGRLRVEMRRISMQCAPSPEHFVAEVREDNRVTIFPDPDRTRPLSRCVQDWNVTIVINGMPRSSSTTEFQFTADAAEPLVSAPIIYAGL